MEINIVFNNLFSVLNILILIQDILKKDETKVFYYKMLYYNCYLFNKFYNIKDITIFKLKKNNKVKYIEIHIIKKSYS